MHSNFVHVRNWREPELTEVKEIQHIYELGYQPKR